MRLKAYLKLGDTPLVFDASVIVIENDRGEPVSIACDIPGGAYTVAHIKDKEFNRILNYLGMDKQVICDTIQGPSPVAGSKIYIGPE